MVVVVFGAFKIKSGLKLQVTLELLNWLQNGTSNQLKDYYLYNVSVPFCSEQEVQIRQVVFQQKPQFTSRATAGK